MRVPESDGFGGAPWKRETEMAQDLPPLVKWMGAGI